MIYKLQKLLCYIIILSIFHTSFQPICAFPDSDKDFDISSPSHPSRVIHPHIEAPQTAEADAVSKFAWNPLKGLLGVTKSVIRHSFKPLAFLALCARGVDAGNEFGVPQNGTMSQNSPSLTSSNGTFILNYHGGDNNIYESHIFPNESVTDPYQINDNTTFINTYPSVTSWNNITFTAWQCSPNICGHTRYENGTTIRDTFLISDNTTSSNYFPYVTSANGKVFTGWVGSPGAKLCGRVSDINGTHISNVFKASNYTTLYQDHPLQFVWSSVDGDFYPIWEGLKNGTYSIYENRVYSDGTVPGNEYLVGKDSTLIQNAPSCTRLLNGNSIKTYNVPENGVNSVKAKITSPNGSTIIEEFPVSPSSIYHQLNSIVTRLPRYNLITWYGLQNGPNIYGRLLSADGITFLSDVFPVNQLPTNNRQLYPYLSATSHPDDGSALLAWTSNFTGVLTTKLRLLTNDTLSSFLYPVPSPVPLPAPVPAPLPAPLPSPLASPRPAPAPVFAFAPLPAPVSEVVPAPILAPSPFTQSSSGAGSLSSSEFSTDMSTTPSSAPSSSSRTTSMDSSSSSTDLFTKSPPKNTAVIIGSVVGGAVFLAVVVGGVLVKVCRFSGGDKTDEPESSPSAEEDVEESRNPPPPTDPDRMTLTNLTKKYTQDLTPQQRVEQYVSFGDAIVDDKKKHKKETSSADDKKKHKKETSSADDKKKHKKETSSADDKKKHKKETSSADDKKKHKKETSSADDKKKHKKETSSADDKKKHKKETSSADDKKKHKKETSSADDKKKHKKETSSADDKKKHKKETSSADDKKKHKKETSSADDKKKHKKETSSADDGGDDDNYSYQYIELSSLKAE